jgi:hypothetical protein
LFNWIITGSKNIAASFAGKAHNVTPDHPGYSEAREAIDEDNGQKFAAAIDVPTAVHEYSQGAIKIVGNQVYYGSHVLNNSLTRRILDAKAKGMPFQPFVAFLDNLVQNPSRRALDELYSWLENQDIPITTDGHWLGYKAVKEDWTDKRTGTVSNRIGETPVMPRSMVDDDWGTDCSQGFHVGSSSYARWFGDGSDKYVIVKVNPRDVVSVPREETTKCRVDRYTVIAEWDQKTEMTWPVYEALGPGKPILPVPGIVRDTPKPKVSVPTHGLDAKIDREDRPQPMSFDVDVFLRGKITESIRDGVDAQLPYESHETIDRQVVEHEAYDVITCRGFAKGELAMEFIGNLKGGAGDYPRYIVGTHIHKRDEHGREIVDEGTTFVNPHDLDHLTTQQRYELRQRAIENIMQGEGRSRQQAEMVVESMTRLQQADLLPEGDRKKFVDPDYRPEVSDLFPIHFDVYDGEMPVGSYNVRTEVEEQQILDVARSVYPLFNVRNRIDHRVPATTPA